MAKLSSIEFNWNGEIALDSDPNCCGFSIVSSRGWTSEMDIFSLLQLSILNIGWVHAQKYVLRFSKAWVIIVGPGKSKTLGNSYLLVSIRDK